MLINEQQTLKMNSLDPLFLLHRSLCQEKLMMRKEKGLEKQTPRSKRQNKSLSKEVCVPSVPAKEKSFIHFPLVFSRSSSFLLFSEHLPAKYIPPLGCRINATELYENANFFFFTPRPLVSTLYREQIYIFPASGDKAGKIGWK